MGASPSKPKDQNLETYSLIWLDSSVNSSQHNVKAQQQLQATISHLLTFEDDEQCLRYIKILSNDDRLILIVSGKLGQKIVPLISSLRQVIAIYVYCMDKKVNDPWAQNFPKIKGVFVSLNALIHQIQSDQTQRQQNKLEESLCMSVFNSNTPNEGQSSTELNGQFIHSQLLIECLIRMKSLVNDKNELISKCKDYYQNNQSQLKIIKEFEGNYSSERSLWWYTRQSFLYRLLNKALRVQDIESLFLFRFFIRDIGQELEKHKCSAPVRVYRAQLMSKDELETLKNSIGEFVSMNTFLSTSINRQQARRFLFSSDGSDDVEQVFFEIDANPQLNNIKPFGSIASVSYFPKEEEVLFMIGSIFRLVEINRDTDGIWIIQMILCSDDDYHLQSLIQHMKKDLMSRETDLLSFGHVLREMGKLDDAEKYFRRFLEQLPEKHSDIALGYHALGMTADSKDDYESSLKWYNKSLEISMQTLKSDDPNIATSHNSIAIVHRKKGDYVSALKSYEKALVIFKRAFSEDHPKVAMCLNNMGVVYQEEKKYSEALVCHQKALIIRQKHLPADHPQLGASYNNIGETNRCLGHYDLALKQLNISLNISKKTLPSQHPNIAMIFQSIGLVYEDKKEYQQALSYFEKTATIYRQSPSSVINPKLIKIEESIKRVTDKLN